MDKASYRFTVISFVFLLLLAPVFSTVGWTIDFEQAETGNDVFEQVVAISSKLSVSSVLPGGKCSAAVLVDIDSGWHINSAHPYQEWLIAAQINYDTIPGLTTNSITYPEATDEPLLGEKMSVYGGRSIVRFAVNVDDNTAFGDYELPVRFTFQPCNSQMCRAPETLETSLHITVGDGGEPVNEELFADTETTSESGEASATNTSDNDIQRLIDKYGVWGYFIALGLAFVTGLLLSFSPCTYPMIPITVSIFAGQKRSVGRGFILSLFYVGSMATVYGIMGLIVAMVGGVFGAWLASPAVVIGIAVVFVVFSLSMFGLYELQVPMFLRQKLGKTKTGGGVGGAILLGLIAALVISPCVGPFVAGILLYVATSGSPFIGFLVLFVFALGLGTLFLIIGTFSSAIAALPGAGGWMESVKKFFGFVLLLMALYFLRTIISPVISAILTGLLLVAFGSFGGGLDRLTPDDGFFARLKKYLGILALIVGGYLLVGSLVTQGLILPSADKWIPSGTVSTESELIHWESDLETGLARAKAENKPVLVDTWATWCANCKVLEKNTFGNPAVAEEAKRFVTLKIQLETADSPVTKDFKARFGLKQYSLPTTLLLDSDGNVKRMMPGVISPEDMILEMRKL